MTGAIIANLTVFC